MKLRIAKHDSSNKAELKATIQHVWGNKLMVNDLQQMCWNKVARKQRKKEIKRKIEKHRIIRMNERREEED
jgi:hypothetical protein